MLLKYKIALLFSVVLFSNCQKIEEESVAKSDFGKSIAHESFLWSAERNDTLNKSFEFSFNEWAQESQSYVELTFTDSSNKVVTAKNNEFHFLVNEKPLEKGSLLLQSKDKAQDEIRLKLVFTDKQSKDHYGYITIRNHDVDRVNDFDELDNTVIYKWSASQELQWNPLKYFLVWCLGSLLGLLLLYLIILRPLIYSRFSKGMLTIQKPFYKNTSLKGAIEVIYTNKKVSQGFFNKLFKGKKIYFVNSYFTTPIHFIPSAKGKIRIRTNGAYVLDPFASTLEKGKNYTITNSSTNEEITITYL
ncbi:hypothetical protein [Myroides odoratimimus]|uniref:Uncharacterized protein n=3 Tax=Myroides odoratimimus TaxID=76832 RepID=A0A0S7EGX7_9FLAO|nr:hypothetical protein [Myroides odoratimimus]ALU27942.1 hypothetical protein AS202_18095 [Myroides odoratimimus]EHO10312.1 hypothetical protein HMPREF9712_01417 [Myroides odoratimimus CCUG 10230]MCO7723361.1 hypothetical protein [Myroides odoratimimus]MDM1033657.1 hypothetical protein [Myroides odoratimimus]MDM1038621.1 hypothetical protein [Myroides odoratimimus]